MAFYLLFIQFFIYINCLFFSLRKEGGSIWIFISGDELPCLESAFLLVRVSLLLERAAAKKGINWTTIKSDCDSLVLNGLLVHRESFAVASTWHLEQYHKRGDLPHLLVGDSRGPIWFWRLPRPSSANSIIHPPYRISSSVRPATEGGRAGEERGVARSGPLRT